ncbi:hypothetical protein KAW50_01550 [candidate division WOR-3 bacterium]|nr:hypothetical protein [candidate division WOR-3 bacterium]
MIRKYILCAFLLWIAQESKGAELPIATASKHQVRPSIASSGTNYLAVWYDSRNAVSTKQDIWGRTISIDGVPQDSFPICDNPGGQFMPEVAWGNDKYLVVWHSVNKELYGQFIKKDGTFIGTSFLIEDTLNLVLPGVGGIDVESNGNNFLVAWAYRSISDGDYNIAGRIVTGVGSFAGPVFTVCDAPDTQFAPKVVGIDTNYLIGWSDFRTGNWTPMGQRVSPSGTPLIGGNFSITAKTEPQRSLALASNDTCVLVVWEEDHGFLIGWDIHGSILDADMKVLHSDIVISVAMWDQRLACAAWHPKTSKFIVGWHDYSGSKASTANIWIRKVGEDGSLDSEQKITTLPVEQREPDIACSNECFLIVWEDYRQGSSNIDIYGYIPACTGKEENGYTNDYVIEKIKSFPNPFVSFVKFIGVKEGVRIYDIRGRLVKELKVHSDESERANQILLWYGKDISGREVPSGTYFVHPVPPSANRTVQKIIKL